MSDLISTPVRFCKSNVNWEKEVMGSTGNKYVVSFGKLFEDPTGKGPQYGWMCTCPVYFHKRIACKHVAQVKEERCGWNGELEPTARPLCAVDGSMCCPKCKGPVETVMVAV